MKNRQRRLFYLLSAALVLCSIFFIQKKISKKRLNVLVLSTCSLSPSRLGFYHPELKFSANVDALANQSFIFENAVTDMSWSNVSGFLSRIPSTMLIKNGYHAIGRPWSDDEADWQRINGKSTPEYYMRIPNFERSTRNSPTKYKDDMVEVQKRLQDRKNWPFILEVHNKIIHLPYLKKLSLRFPISNFLSEDSKKYIQEYQENMEKYPERLPFSFYVSQRGTKLTETVIKTLKLEGKIATDLRSASSSPTFVGLLNNPQILAKWKNSKYFESDLKVIKETYDSVLQFYDLSMNKLLKLYDDKELADNTVVIFTGDHGEAFFQHGYMVHGETVFDEMIKFPLFVKFPGQKISKRINLQFHQEGIASIVEKIISGELNQDNFEKFIEKENNQPMIASRNCANDIKSLRYKNEWKYIVNLKNDQKFLYDLKNDPLEKTNVFDENPKISSFLEESIDDVIAKQTPNKMLHLCRTDSE